MKINSLSLSGWCYKNNSIKKQNILNNESKNKSGDSFHCSYPINYYLNPISFCRRKPTAVELIDRIGEENFPSENIKEKLRELGNTKYFSLYKIHTDYYDDLLSCETLEEAKEKYPEFSDVLDFRDVDTGSFYGNHIVNKIARGKTKGIDTDNLSLELLKRYYGRLKSPARKENYFDMTFVTVIKLFDALNIKQMNKNYLITAATNNPELFEGYSQRGKKNWEDEAYKARMANMSRERWQNPEDRERIINAQKEAAKDPILKQRHSEIMKERWQNPEYRERQIQLLIKRWQKEGYKEHQSLLIKYSWLDEECRAKRMEGIQKVQNSKEHKEKMEVYYKAKRYAWKRHPEIRRAMSEIAKNFHTLPGILVKRNKGKELPEIEMATLLSYYKACSEIIPNYQKIIGEEYSKILVEWGIKEE